MWRFGIVKKKENMRPKEINTSHPNRLDFCFLFINEKGKAKAA